MSLTPIPLYREIASVIDAWKRCKSSSNKHWEDKHDDTLNELEAMLPSGSGIDCGTKLNREKSSPNKLVFSFSFHHMDENGMYSGWTEHELIVTPSLMFGIDLRITGRDRNQIKDYLYDVYRDAMTSKVVFNKSSNRLEVIHHV